MQFFLRGFYGNGFDGNLFEGGGGCSALKTFACHNPQVHGVEYDPLLPDKQGGSV